MKTFPSPYAVAEVVAVASEYEGGSETLDSGALESAILKSVKFNDNVFLGIKEFGERMRRILSGCWRREGDGVNAYSTRRGRSRRLMFRQR